MRKNLTLLLSLLAFTFSKAQFLNYTKDNVIIIPGTYTDLAANGTAITTDYLGQPLGTTTTNANSAIQNIGFTFNFAGTNYTQFVLNTNGFIKLGTDTVATVQSKDVLSSSATTATNVIYALNTNLQPTGNSEYRVFTTGTAGSKSCTIQFKAVTDSGCPVCGPSDRQFDNMEFQIILYEASNNIEFVFGSFTASVNAANFVQTNCGIKLTDPAHSLNVTKSSQTAFTSAAFVEGPYPGNHFNIRNSILPSPGVTYQFVPIPILTNNVQIQTTYALGKVPKLYDNTLSLYVQNIGSTNYTNFPVNLTITGANSYTNVQTIPTLNVGDKQLVTFPSFSWPNAGTNTMALKIQHDDDDGDNIDTIRQTVSALTIGTAFDTTIEGSLGQTSSSIDMATKFRCPGASVATPNKIKSVSTYFSAAGKTYKVYIYGVDADTPKTKIYNMPTATNVTTKAGKTTFTFPTPVSVTGDFFVVITQLSTTTSLGMGFKQESPIRTKTFYGRSPQGSSIAASTGWFDFAPSNSFMLMVDVDMQNAFLPVKLDNFKGYNEGKTNVLNWQSSSEINSFGFEIQRSANGKDFEKIGFENSRGGSNTIATYNYVDTKPFAGINYYRLRQLDKDGKETFSEIISINSNNKIKLEVVNLFPNPSKDNATLIFNSASTDKMNISITNMLGKVVATQTLNAIKGENKIQLDTKQLPAGNYLINIAEMNTENAVTTKFIKQ